MREYADYHLGRLRELAEQVADDIGTMQVSLDERYEEDISWQAADVSLRQARVCILSVQQYVGERLAKKC